MATPTQRKGLRIGTKTVYENQTFDEVQKAQIMEFVQQESKGLFACPSNFEGDWSDGLVLIKLLETLTNKKFERYCRKPKLEIQKMDNINIVISFMENYYRIKVFGFTPKEVVNGNEKQIVGLLFLLMTHVKKLRGGGEGEGGKGGGRRWRRGGGRGDWERKETGDDDDEDDSCSSLSSFSCISPRVFGGGSSFVPSPRSASFSGVRSVVGEKEKEKEKEVESEKEKEKKKEQEKEKNQQKESLPPLPSAPPPSITPTGPTPSPPSLPTTRSSPSPSLSPSHHPSSPPSQEVCEVIYATVKQWASDKPKESRSVPSLSPSSSSSSPSSPFPSSTPSSIQIRRRSPPPPSLSFASPPGSFRSPPFSSSTPQNLAPPLSPPSRPPRSPSPRSPPPLPPRTPSPSFHALSPRTPRTPRTPRSPPRTSRSPPRTSRSPPLSPRSPTFSPLSPPLSPEKVHEHISAAVREWEGDSPRPASSRSSSPSSPSKNRTSSLLFLSSSPTPPPSSPVVPSPTSPSSPSISRGGTLKSPPVGRRRGTQEKGAPLKKRISSIGSFARHSTLPSPKDRKEEGEWEIDGLSDSEESETEEEERERRERESEGSEGGVSEVSEGEEVTVERFVEKWGEKGYKGGSLDRLFYFYSCFGPGGENEALLMRLQAIARQLATQRAYEMKINRRNRIAKEILETERSYVKSLQTLITVFQEPLTAKQIVSQETLRAIFGTICPILATAESLHKELEERMNKWYSEGQRIGDIFQKYVSIFKIYTDYVNNYNTSLEQLAILKKNNVEFRAVLKEGMKKCEGYDLNSFLVLPIQRIPRYVMLLEEISKYTPLSHPDSEPLQQVVIDIRGVAEYVNERKRTAENQLQVAKCMEQISGLNFQLVSPSRRYFDEGFLYEKSFEKKNLKKRYIFLFNNLLLITSLTKKGGGGGTLKGGTLGREGGEGGKETTTGGGKKGGSYGKRGGEVITGSQGRRYGSRVGGGTMGGTLGGMGGGEGELFQFNCCIDFQNVELFDVEVGGEGGKEEGGRGGFGLEFGFGVRKVAASQDKFHHLFFAPDRKRKDQWMKNIDQGISETIECDVSRLCLVAGVEERSGVKVKKEGILKVMGSTGKWHRRKVILSNGILEVQTVRSVVKERLLLGGCTVRMMEVSDRQNSFRLSNSSQLVVLAAESNCKRFEWINSIRDSIREIMAYQERLKENPGLMVKELVGQRTGNDRCADCNKGEIEWANLAAGVFVCRLCGSIHRTLTHTMKLKPVGRCGHWTIEEVMSMKTRGNDKSGKELEEKVETKYEKPTETDPHSKKVAYIENKYRHFLPDPSPSSPTLNSPQSTSAPITPVPPISFSSSSSSPSPSPSPSSARSKRRALPSPLSPRSQKKDEEKVPLSPHSGSDVRRCLMEMKKNEGWDYYFVTLKGNRLIYQDSPRRQKTGEVVLDMAAVFCEMNSEKLHTFKLVTLTKQYLFACPSEDEMIQWVKLIQRNSESHGPTKKKRTHLKRT